MGLPNKFPHEGPFKPSNPPKSSVIDKTLSRFPEWKPNTAKPAAQRRKVEVPWRRTYIERTRPTPSVNAMRTNVRASFMRSAGRLR